MSGNKYIPLPSSLPEYKLILILFIILAELKQNVHQNAETSSDSLPIKLITEPSIPNNAAKILGGAHRIITQLSKNITNDSSLNAESNIMDNTVPDIKFSRTPPWQKNSILSQQQAITHQSNESILPTLQQHMLTQTMQLKNVKQQPPWHDESKLRNMSKKRPNFKEDPTGYLDQQTAILHNSILSVRSPDLQDEHNLEHQKSKIHADEELNATKSLAQTKYTRDVVNLKMSVPIDNNQANSTGTANDFRHLSVMHQEQENQNSSCIQHHSKPHIAIGPNGQPVRIIQNTQQIIYAGNNNNFRIHSALSQHSQSQYKFNETQSGNTHNSSIVLSHSQPIVNQSSVNSRLNQQAKGSMTLTVPIKFSDENFRNSSKLTTNNSLASTAGLSISVPQSFDFTNNEQKNCDNINQKPNQPQLLIKQATTKSSKIFKYVAGNIRKAQESPVSSSTHHDILTTDEILPAQVGAISTSNENNMAASPTISGVRADNAETSVFSTKYHNMYMAAQTSGRNTITSVLAGKAMTSTTSTTQSHVTNEKVKSLRPNVTENIIHVPSNQKFIKATNNQIIQITKSPSGANSSIFSQSNSSSASSSHNNTNGIQTFHQICAEGSTNQIIMTSTGQILMMPPTVQENKESNQVMIGSPANNALLVNSNSAASNVVINTQSPHHAMRNEIIQGINENGSSNMIGSGNSVGMVIQSRNVLSGGSTNILQSPNSSNNFILGTSSNMQSMILNNSSMISHNGTVLSPTGTTIMPAANNANIIGTANTNKVISNTNNMLASASIINQQHVMGPNNQLISGNTAGSMLSPNSGLVGQQTVLLNQLSNGSYVIQPQTITVDGQVMNVISSDGTNQFMQQRLMVSPDSKRRTIKRKSTSLSPSTQLPNESSLPSPTVQQNSTTSQQMLQITPHYQSQSFQISPAGTGITLVQNKPSPINTAAQQQILLQNGSTILQPINLIGQQLLLPTGLMIAPDATTLLQIQNVASTKDKNN